MDASVASISPAALRQSLQSEHPPLVIDVRREERFRESTYLLRGALRRDPDTVEAWGKTLPKAAGVVLYCVHGHEASQAVAKALGARYLEGGIEAWRQMGGEISEKPSGAATRWVTRERPKIDRIACPWLIRRFVDPGAEFLYVPPGEVLRTAEEKHGEPYDVPEVHFSHEGERCSFDAFLRHYGLEADPALAELAVIVRGADTHRPELAPQAAGLAAISLGLSRNFQDDYEMLEHGMVMYDALYAWSKEGKQEIHTWNPDLYKPQR
jgi:rhodanese-related sulfurtransferase